MGLGYLKMIKLEGGGVKRILMPKLINVKEYWLDWIFAEIPGRKAIERVLGVSGIFGILVVVDVGRGGEGAVLSD